MNFATTLVVQGDLVYWLWLHPDSDTPQDEWARALQTFRDYKAKHPNSLGRVRVLVISDGGAPNLTQRGQMNGDVFEKMPVKTAVLTNALSNPIKRGIVKAMTWVNPTLRAYAPAEWREAFRHVEVGDAFDILTHFSRLQGELSPEVSTLRAIKASFASGSP